MRPHLKYCIQAWGSQHKKDTELLERVQKRPLRWAEDWSSSPTSNGMRELGLSSQEKRRLLGDRTAALKYLKGVYNQEGDWLFTQSDSDRTRVNGVKLKEGVEALAQAAQRSCGCPIPGGVQGQVGCSFEQPGLMEVASVHSSLLERNSL